MKSKVSLVLIAVMMLGATGFAFADGLFNPASIYANLTGTTIEEAYAEKLETKSTFGELAKNAGVYEEFQAEAVEAKTELIKERVEDGTLTQEQADAVLSDLAECDGEGFGGGNGLGQGRMAGNGMGGGGMMARSGQAQ